MDVVTDSQPFGVDFDVAENISCKIANGEAVTIQSMVAGLVHRLVAAARIWL